jgi:tetratricopeptide (TPR) repeat protein
MEYMPLKPSTISHLKWQSTFNRLVSFCFLTVAVFAFPAAADEAADVSELLRAKQYPKALNKADSFLFQNPRDAQMRFLKGVILTEQNKPAEAITIFTKLTEDFPHLPEPHNNLAVLYAAGGQYDKARAALDRAIRTSPTYATAYENLGDIHAKLASQAYDKALQLDSGNSGAKSKLTLVRTLITPALGSNTAVAVAPTKPAAKPPASTTSGPIVASADPKVAAASAAPANPKAATAAIPPAPPAIVAKVAPAKPELSTKAAAAGTADHDAVLNAVNGWAKAWSARDVKRYLSFYGNDFQLPSGLSRKAWMEERRSRIAGKDRIDVKIESPQVTINGDAATVKFRQAYVSDRLTANSRKTLILAKRGGRWLIKQERTGT